MKFRRLIAATLAIGVATSMAACGAVGEQLANTDTAQTAKQEAQAAATAQAQKFIEGLGFTGVSVSIEDEDEKAKVAPKKPAPTPSGSTSATPTAKPKPSTKTVKFQVISVDANFPKAFRCGINVEQRLDKYGVPTGGRIFDEVLVPGTTGVEVEGDARNDTSFAGMSRYVFTKHPECVLPGVLTAPVTP